MFFVGQNSCKNDYIESLTPPEIDLSEVQSKFWERHRDQRQKTHPTMYSNPKSIFQNWLHQNQHKTAYSHLHPIKSTFPIFNQNSEDAIVISVESRVQRCIHTENLFSKLDLEGSHAGLCTSLKQCCEYRMQIPKTRLESQRQSASNGISICPIWHVLYWARVVWKWL